MSELNIPGEVLREARTEFYHQYPVLPDLALERHAQVIAQWARGDALGEAAKWATEHDDEYGYVIAHYLRELSDREGNTDDGAV